MKLTFFSKKREREMLISPTIRFESLLPFHQSMRSVRGSIMKKAQQDLPDYSVS